MSGVLYCWMHRPPCFYSFLFSQCHPTHVCAALRPHIPKWHSSGTTRFAPKRRTCRFACATELRKAFRVFVVQQASSRQQQQQQDSKKCATSLSTPLWQAPLKRPCFMRTHVVYYYSIGGQDLLRWLLARLVQVRHWARPGTWKSSASDQSWKDAGVPQRPLHQSFS